MRDRRSAAAGWSNAPERWIEDDRRPSIRAATAAKRSDLDDHPLMLRALRELIEDEADLRVIGEARAGAEAALGTNSAVNSVIERMRRRRFSRLSGETHSS